MKQLFIILLCLSCISVSFGQRKKAGDDGMDSVFVKGRSFLILADSSLYVENDTLIILPDSIAVKLKKDESRRSEEFYGKIKEQLYKTKFTKRLYKIIFKDPGKPKGRKTPVASRGHNYDLFKGKTIDKVSIKKLDIFGTSINDTTRSSDNWWLKSANKLHTYTRGKVIRNNIFFKSGDKVDPDLIIDSERILRSLPFVRDSRIYLVPGESKDKVDAIVIVKDVWSLSFDGGASGPDEWDFALTERNLFGLGHELRNEINFDERNKPKAGYSATYAINNIKNTFITGQFNFVRSQDLDRTQLHVFRNFITPETKYAGGIQITNQNNLVERIEPDTILGFFAKFNNQDFWFGRSYQIDRTENARTNIQLAARFSRTRFLDRPFVSEDTNQLFFDSNLYLFSIGYSQRSYEKSSLILGYGRTEDIPEGMLYQLTFGRDANEFNTRGYIATKASKGGYLGRIGYVRPEVAIGGFIRQGKFEQGMLSFNMSYFSYLYRLKRLNFRQFFNLDYTIGIRRFNDELITINDESGIRGLNSVFLRGTRRLSFKSETVLFTPVYFFGFRMALFSFIDIAIVNGNSKTLFRNRFYQGYGLGFRFRNENLAFNTIQIRLAWYPKTPGDVSDYDLEFTGRTSLQIGDFDVREPEVLEFR
ncbi:hypothetical protein FNH22_02795 [Fulvivirga sp. M361]|uniref:hypothetical protein n=1 Tax=Fulvivirga sp. M361 TaxID=2594266 RepID=UPI00117B9914|nr:hypothetical protein [Fulvivirga sp. M361]TRX61722.1 hypothetical protein FNH22_02795 [Fulvivirga sp. M361]